ncbi:MAG: protein BatD [Xanthomonadaceae bacterium]|nr:protein BatD [Xanthomonadaceae bacterium]
MSARTPIRALLLLLLCAQACSAAAETRAWLDRDRIALGETTTLSIETDQALTAAPDYSALMGDFAISNNVSSRQLEVVNGVARLRELFAVALQPKREGLIPIPRLVVGNVRIQPLTVSVTVPMTTPAHAGDPVFVESQADAQEPYVQQAVGFTVRLYYSGPISGQLDQPAPEGASLQKIGDDVQYVRRIGDHDYTVLERHFLLIPERSGTLTIRGAHFQGTGATGFFDDLLGNGGRSLRADAAPRFLRVQPAPANAPQPWLPLRALTLRYLQTPARARAGEAATVIVEATADGATVAQMPELQLPVGGGAQVFAEPPQSDETYTDGRPQVRMVRRFSIVAAQAGPLHVNGPGIAWWDVRAGLARTASLPGLDLQVSPGVAAASARSTGANERHDAVVDASTPLRLPGIQGDVNPWALAAVLFAIVWLLTLMWALKRRRRPEVADAPVGRIGDAERASVTVADLKRALDHEDMGRIADVLCALHSPPAMDLDSVRASLDDPRQVAAVDALQSARWGDGDGSAARAALRNAFGRGPHWKKPAPSTANDVLPPLYPRG